ncbi:hypothetical protein SADUNF_Sadunf04G0113400 [Salix dunnii]|uniref:Dehydrin n=1 Tax=Salix dunnii TaxID=1413687 RepID=A0A835K749_9ROSI|nr:hypothetical protein SADUNF_Sadunf04G0113400 [Salix dunnii]
MASTIRDEQGNPIQLTDEHSSPVHLTDEHGNPVQIIGIATTKQPPTSLRNGGSDQVTGTGLLSSTAKSEDATKGTEIHETGQVFQGGHKKEEQTEISSTSSPGSVKLQPEDDGQGGRKGLKQKIKEKLTGGKHREEHGHTVEVDTTTTGPAGEQYQEHQKKSVVEKIKEKLPGHHSHH